jgi:uncharacterized membrane protein
MREHKSAAWEMFKTGELFLGHVFAIALGVVCMSVGVAMGVTLVLLPLGILVGFAGLFLFLWGLFGREGESQTSPPSPPCEIASCKRRS